MGAEHISRKLIFKFKNEALWIFVYLSDSQSDSSGVVVGNEPV